MDKTYRATVTLKDLKLDDHVALKETTFSAVVERIDTEKEAWWGGAAHRYGDYDAVIPPLPIVKVTMVAYVPLSEVVVTVP